MKYAPTASQFARHALYVKEEGSGGVFQGK